MSTRNLPTTNVLRALTDRNARISLGNVEAIYTLSIFVPFLGALPAVIYAYGVYSSEAALGSPAWFYFNQTEASFQAHRFATKAGFHYIEPIAAPTNIAFWLSGVLLFVLPWLGDAPLPNQTYGIAMMLSLLGATSYSFHLDGSRTKTWQHAADRFSMYTLLAYMACTAPNGLWHAYHQLHAPPSSTAMLVSNIAALLAIATACSYQEVIDSTSLLLPSGAIIITCNSLTMGLLAMRRAAAGEAQHPDEVKALRPKAANRFNGAVGEAGRRYRSLPPYGHFWVQLASSAILQCLPFFFGMLLNRASDDAFATAVYDDGPCCPTNLTDADRREARRLHDIYHGLWHVLAGVFCFQCALITVEGLTGQLSSPMGSSREEWVAMGLIVSVSALFLLLQAKGAPFWAILNALAVVEIIVIAFGAVALRRMVRRHHRRRRQINGATPPVPSSPATPSTVTPTAPMDIGPTPASNIREQGFSPVIV